jgi:hypothetical protein
MSSNAKALSSRTTGQIETNGNGRRYVAIDEVIESELRRIEKSHPTNGKSNGANGSNGSNRQSEEGTTTETVDEQCANPIAR